MLAYNFRTDESDDTKMDARYATCLAEVKNATKEKRTKVHSLVTEIIKSALSTFDHPGGRAKLEEMARSLIITATGTVDMNLDSLDI